MASRSTATPAVIQLPRLLLVISSLALLSLGLVMIFSASSVEALLEEGDSLYYFKRQLAYVAVGIIAAAACALIPHRIWATRLAWTIWGIAIALLVLTVAMGIIGLGAKRWLSLGPFSFQPSEFAKIAVMLLAGKLVFDQRQVLDARGGRKDRDVRGGLSTNKDFMIRMAICLVVPVILIFIQPDLGTLIITVVGVLAMWWFGEMPLRGILLGLASLLVVGTVGLVAYGFRSDRILAWLKPWENADGVAYQVVNSFYAFGDGGLFGLGLGMSRQKYSYLPEAHTDFIFAIIGEELGLVGAVAVVLLFMVFIYAGLQIAHRAPDLMGRMVAGSSTVVVGFQAFLNIMCVIGLLPVTGKPLPFLSYGGSSIIATLIFVGLILSVSFHSVLNDPGARRRRGFQVIEGGLEE